MIFINLWRSEARAIWRESACKVGMRHDGSGVKDVLGLVRRQRHHKMTGTTHFWFFKCKHQYTLQVPIINYVHIIILYTNTYVTYTNSFQLPHALSSVTKDVNAEFKSWKRSFSSLLTLECLEPRSDGLSSFPQTAGPCLGYKYNIYIYILGLYYCYIIYIIIGIICIISIIYCIYIYIYYIHTYVYVYRHIYISNFWRSPPWHSSLTTACPRNVSQPPMSTWLLTSDSWNIWVSENRMYSPVSSNSIKRGWRITYKWMFIAEGKYH